MAPVELSEMDCSIARTLDAIGDKWSLLILRDAFYGVTRFEDFQKDLGVARNILTERLKKLTARGVLQRTPYSERPARFEYRLTAKGRDLLPVLLTMMRWGDQWSADEGEAPVKLIHTDCGRATHAKAACAHCGGELILGKVRVSPLKIGPTASAGPAVSSRPS